MSSNGGLGREATKFYARLAEMLADKRKPNTVLFLPGSKESYRFH